MTDIITILKNAIANGTALMCITVVNSKGSVPRKSGALMLVASKGWIYGSIGGGIAEYSAIEEGIQLLKRGEDFQKKYILHPASEDDIGAVCGGEIDVRFEYMGANGSSNLKLQELLQKLSAEKEAQGLVYIFGGGHVGQELVPVLSRLDFRCTVFEDRAEFADAELFPAAENIILGSFSDIEKSITITKNDYVVILTRGHKFDYDSMCFALHSDARYIGVIGSKAKHEFVRGRLAKEAGFTKDIINAARVHAPIGIAMYCETPAEIAISIAAELINVRCQSTGN